jgi:F-type H+-transporting ATPase subunit delta
VATDEPMMAGMAGRYAGALFELAASQNATAAVEADLNTFDQMLTDSEDLTRLVRSPVISAHEQAKALSAILKKAGAGELTQNFFSVLAQNRRLFAAGDIIRTFRSLAAKARGEVTAEVTSAVALSDTQVAELKKTLKASVCKDVTLAAKVDPSLLGGLVVKLGSRMIDSSLKSKLAGLKTVLQGSA